MSFARNADVDLYYEAIGPEQGEPVLLLNGANRQCTDFSDSFCHRLVTAGFRAIRFDARDTGLSTPMTSTPSNLIAVFEAAQSGGSAPMAYDLDVLASDAFAVMDAAGVTAAHLIGRSLGSGVAQMMAIRRPERVLSLTLVIAFSRSLASTVTPETVARIAAETIPDADVYAARQVKGARAMGSPDYFDPARVETEARTAFARGVHPGAMARQFAAGVGAPDMRPQLGELRTPTLVIHGALDRATPVALAQETAAAIPGARLEVIEDMGHDGPPELVARWAELFIAHARRQSVSA